MTTHTCGGRSLLVAILWALSLFSVEAAVACDPARRQDTGTTQDAKALGIPRCAPETAAKVTDEQSRRAAAARSKELAATKEAKDVWSKAREAEAKGDFTHAARLYRTLARQGHGPAAKRLGDMYATGIATVPKDLVESRQWYAIARENGEKVAEQR